MEQSGEVVNKIRSQRLWPLARRGLFSGGSTRWNDQKNLGWHGRPRTLQLFHPACARTSEIVWEDSYKIRKKVSRMPPTVKARAGAAAVLAFALASCATAPLPRSATRPEDRVLGEVSRRLRRPPDEELR